MVVEDLDTGVWYGPARIWTEGGGRLRPTIAAEFTLQNERIARVAGCWVISRRGNAGNHRMITLLRLEEAHKGR